MQAILLAAGDASRLVPLSHHRPKGMLLLGGKPILQHAVEALVANGVEEMVMVVGSHGERIQAFFGNGEAFGCRIAYAHQARPTGTADAVRAAVPRLNRDAPVVIVPGHLLLDAEAIRPVMAVPDGLLLAAADRTGVQWVPTVSGDRIKTVQALEAAPGATRISTGIFHASCTFIDGLDNGLSDCKQVDEAIGRYADYQTVTAAEVQGTCAPVTEPWDLLRLNDAVLDHLPEEDGLPPLAHAKQPIHVGTNTTLSPTASIIGPVTIGDGCHVGDRTVIGPYVAIRNNSVIGSHCEVRRSIINNNVTIDSRAVIRGSILDDGVAVGPGFIVAEEATPDGPRGCILGSDSTIGAAVLAKAGSVLGPGSEVADRATVTGA